MCVSMCYFDITGLVGVKGDGTKGPKNEIRGQSGYYMLDLF